MSRRTIALSSIAALLVFSSTAAADTSEVKPPPALQASGGTAAILASLIDAALHGPHANDFRCVIDENARSCRKASAAAYHVVASEIICSQSDVAVGSFSCTLSEGGGHGRLVGHQAFELFSALHASGLNAEGAAGHIELGATSVDCSVDMKALREKAGGGASCKLKAL